MASKLTRLSHKIAIQLHLVAESCTVRSSRSRQPQVRAKIAKLRLSALFIMLYEESITESLHRST